MLRRGARRGADLAAKCRSKPVDQLLLLRIGELRLGMHERVVKGRHVSTLDRSNGAISPALRRTEVGKVDDRTTFNHVSLYQPGERSDIRIPGPGCLISMAVATCLHCQLLRLWAVPCDGVSDRWISMTVAVRNELNESEENQTGRNADFHKSNCQLEQSRVPFPGHRTLRPERNSSPVTLD